MNAPDPKFSEEIRALMGVSDPEPASAESILAEIRAAFGMMKPRTTEEMRDHHFETRIAPRLRDFGFEDRYQRQNLMDGEDPRCGLQRDILAKVNAKFTNCGAIVALVGPRGTGKTTIAAQLAADRLWEDWQIALAPQRRGVPCRVTSYWKACDVVARFKAYYGDFGTIEMNQLSSLLEHMCGVECLVIDELHEVPDDSRHKDRLLTDILDKRYSARRDTLLISNQKQDAFWSTLPESIKSRITEHGGVIPCEWLSFRDHAAQ